MVTIEGVIETITFKNDENGYVIGKVKDNSDKLITFVGIVPFATEGLHVKIEGEWTVHPKFGEQLKVSNIEEVLPTSIIGIERYLSSGIITGIGPVTAKKIVEKFGEDTLTILDENIDRLREIEGVGEKKLNTIKNSYEKGRGVRKINIFLQTYGITPTQCAKIYKKYGEESIEIVKENPYKLTEDISGIGFKSADKIARSLGIEASSPFRIKSGIIYVLNNYCALGNSCMPIDLLISQGEEILLVSADDIEKNLMEISLDLKVKIEEIDHKVYVYPLTIYYSELSVTHKLITLSTSDYNKLDIDVDKEIKEFEDENDISLQEIQKEAVKGIFNTGVEVITGGPGTGKTTIINCITTIFEDNGYKVFMAAPTGRAAKRITESTGREAKTIHRLLEMGVSEDEGIGFNRGEEKPLQCDVLIVDEASMIDIILMSSLLKSISIGTRVVIVGDSDQLPSVGPGNVLRDIIDSDVVKVVKLKEIFRQGKESMIVTNAHKINSGEMPILNVKNNDFFFINKNGDSVVLNEILGLIDKRLVKFNTKWNKLKDIQVLTPMKKGNLGSINLNKEIQNVLNPHHPMKKEIEYRNNFFRIGDKVMQTKNNYSIKWERIKGFGDPTGEGVFNGDVGYIKDIDEENNKISVVFDEEKLVKYEEMYFDELELSYAMTIHKSQGSEFPVVILPVFMGNNMLMNRNLLYTAITRAKQLVVIVGNQKSLAFMVSNTKTSERYSTLDFRIKDILKE
ncbi:helicase, RecD/TraA family [Clostridium bornimense]|uniref:ATP-dependent RecD2 DNA helicase n=1 Tax=Clostridium bornimense TaxID=1216932 RepID=W6S520_9CLOT|nr:ATP-dependent RecD-like DNA helicase [Clostridium bornimense]CDM69407.1 helicase, RecD/TraA family [Clostridium bornimense]